MSVDSTTLTGILAGLSTVLGTVSGLKVYDHEPRDLDSLPAATIVLQEAQRAELGIGQERRESELGRVDLYCAWTVRVWHQGDYTQSDEQSALQLVGRIVGAIDADETLGNAVLGCTVANAARERVEAPPDSGREYLTYVLTVTTSSHH